MARSYKVSEARATIRAWYRHRVANLKSWNAKELAQEAIEHFERESPQVLRDYMRDQILEDLAKEAHVMASQSRALPSQNRLIISGSSVMTMEGIQEKAKAKAKTIFSGWVENVDDRGYVHLNEMSLAELRTAAFKRESVALTHINIASFYRELADNMVEGQLVKDAYTTDQLFDIYRKTTGQEGEDDVSPLSLERSA